MIDAVLTRKQLSLKGRLTVKGLVSLGVILLAVGLPQLVHLAAGVPGGVQWLPMYLPVLLGGCLLGWQWGLAVGLLSPLVSFAVTSLFGSPMPIAARLPYMMAELAVFALVAGFFSKRIEKQPLMAFPAVLAAEVAGRSVFLALVALFGRFSDLAFSVVLDQVKTGMTALYLQAILVPLAIVGLHKLLFKENGRD